MKTYRELYFKGTSQQLRKFTKQIGNFVIGDWRQVECTEQLRDYISFDYIGSAVDNARVFIDVEQHIETGQLRVDNIVPLEKNQLSIDEYNAVLIQFYNDIIKPYKENGADVDISQPTDDIFNPLSVISETALKKLEQFCYCANKSTGSSHPCDEERWFDFICQTVDDGMEFSCDDLAKFLKDETYWGEKPKDFIGVVGKFAWNEEHAHKLASEYEALCNILHYYKKTRGI
ncbi:MAG: hypothetical protein IJT23_08100 [Clostridia bacterium]|nr:hypothetical protein [Clostridia bacterium]